jgi:hypothetical protein
MHARLQAVLLLVLLLTVGAFAGSALSQWWQRAPGPMAAPGSPGSTTPGASIDGRVRVEVLNGGGMPNMARSATDELRDGGFDVVYFGNADRFDHDSSFVVARTERLDWARAVADRLGIREVRSEPDDNLYLDVTVVLGREWQPRPVSETPPVADEDGRPWWDPRTWVPRRPMSPGASRHLADPARDDETEGPIDASDDSAASVGPDTGEPRE